MSDSVEWIIDRDVEMGVLGGGEEERGLNTLLL